MTWTKNAALAFIPFVIFGLVFGIGYVGVYLGTSVSSSQSPNVVDYSSLASSEISSNPTLGVELFVSLNSTIIAQSGSIGVNISEYNLLPTTNNVSVSSDWALQESQGPGLRMGPCGNGAFPFGIALLRGYYSSSNISSDTSLYLYNPDGIYGCPADFFGVAQYYSFEPSSDSTAVCQGAINSTGTDDQNCEPPIFSTFPLSHSVGIGSYWNSSGTEHSLTEGVYTIVTGDEWGQLVILHFAVVPQTSLNGLTIGSVAFSSSWHYVGNVTLSGSESSCVILRLPCPSNTQNPAEELTNGNGDVAYVETMTLCEAGSTTKACTTFTIVLINNNLYCINPNDNIPSQPSCPAILG